MIDEKEFFIDLATAIPSNTEWSMQSSFSEVVAALDGIPINKNSTDIDFTFTEDHRSKIIGLANADLFQCINMLMVYQGTAKLLEAFDGFVIVILSKSFDVTTTNLEKYLNNDLLYVSDDW